MKQVNIYFILSLIMLIMVIIMILLSVAFLTLLERKFLGYLQIRKGPNKVGYLGILQPFSDAIKLMSKDSYYIMKSNYLFYYFSPIFMFMLILMMWLVYPFYMEGVNMELGLIYLMCCFSFSVYGLLITGWSSNSSFSVLGAIRSLSQSISYEVSLSLIILSTVILIESFNMKNFFLFQNNFWLMFFMWPLGLMFFFSLMAELNRTPFDFSEGESELVSGFNVEYMSGGFILIFLSEYASILFLSFFFVIIFCGGDYFNFIYYLKIIFMVNLIIWFRGTFPRFRYDLLMYLCWLMILPFTLNYMYMIINLKMLIYK